MDLRKLFEQHADLKTEHWNGQEHIKVPLGLSYIALENLIKNLTIPVVSRSIGESTKPTLKELTPEELKEYGSGGCRICIYRHKPQDGYECSKCVKENTSNQYCILTLKSIISSV